MKKKKLSDADLSMCMTVARYLLERYLPDLPVGPYPITVKPAHVEPTKSRKRSKTRVGR